MVHNVVSVVPSKGRPETLGAKTLSWLVCSIFDFMIFVEPQDYEAYKKIVSKENLVVIDKNDAGLGYVKSYIAKWLKDQPYDIVIKLDDDVRSMNGRGSIPSYEKIAKDYDMAIKYALVAFEKYTELAAIGFPYRWELWSDNKLWTQLNARLQTVYITKKEYFVGDPRVSTFEDFHNYLYIRSKNKMTLRYGLIGINTDVGKGSGGLQSFDRHKMALAEVEVLKELYPALEIKKVEGKSWGIEPVLKGEFFNIKGL